MVILERFFRSYYLDLKNVYVKIVGYFCSFFKFNSLLLLRFVERSFFFYIVFFRNFVRLVSLRSIGFDFSFGFSFFLIY